MSEPTSEAVLYGLRCTNQNHPRSGEVYGVNAEWKHLARLTNDGCSELVVSYDGGAIWTTVPTYMGDRVQKWGAGSAGVERLRERHVPTLAEASTPGVWNVYCAACSDAAQDYVQVCAAGRWQTPAQLVAYADLVQARGYAADAVQMVADLTEPGEPISGVAPPPVQFGVRCADPSHPEGEHREVYSVTYVAHRLQPMANSIPCYELVFSRDGGRTWSEADGGSGS